MEERPGKPSLQIAGFQVWVHNQPYASSDNPSDIDCLDVTAHCGAQGASVWATGAILGASSFDRFASQCNVLYATSRRGVTLLV